MVIFMPYYRQHGQLFQPHTRTQPPSNGSNNTTTTTTAATIRINRCKFISNMFCRFIFSLLLLTISLFLFRISVENASDQKEGSNIIAAILLTISIVSFIRTCQKLRRYFIILDTRRRLIQRLRYRQLAYDLELALNNIENPNSLRNVNTDLPSYKELFPSHPNLHNSSNDPSSSLPPPSYDDFVKNFVIRHPTTNFPLSSLPPHSVSLTSLSSSSQSQTNPTRCIWLTDRTRRPLCIRGTVTYV
ncbi:unnamed protein product [Adineta steineri]|uniref:Uncharacterized protein n=1 Tax=Adineta steineri TaxID=433720 RepID=A0A819E801_9BILA|nr:unnamed protein product [Adineta steineri]CAF3846049.1 unnamed protein product [Adineta steineri]